MARSAWSSLGYSVQSYLPYYAPPVAPARNVVQAGGAAVVSHPEAQRIDQHTAMVNRKPRLLGNRTLYSRGGQVKPWFRMIATGRVESTKFQPVLNYQWSGEFNDSIYEAGYPRNLGYSFKVRTIPKGAKQAPLYKMQPAPRITKSIFSRRAFGSGIHPVPAVSTNQPKRGRR
jgi:hypothetical protein